MPRKEVVTKDEIICQFALKDGALIQASLEKLTLHGVPATGQPRRGATLPPRTWVLATVADLGAGRLGVLGASV